jgi:hypothetical protein
MISRDLNIQKPLAARDNLGGAKLVDTESQFENHPLYSISEALDYIELLGDSQNQIFETSQSRDHDSNEGQDFRSLMEIFHWIGDKTIHTLEQRSIQKIF